MKGKETNRTQISKLYTTKGQYKSLLSPHSSKAPFITQTLGFKIICFSLTAGFIAQSRGKEEKEESTGTAPRSDNTSHYASG